MRDSTRYATALLQTTDAYMLQSRKKKSNEQRVLTSTHGRCRAADGGAALAACGAMAMPGACKRSYSNSKRHAAPRLNPTLMSKPEQKRRQPK